MTEPTTIFAAVETVDVPARKMSVCDAEGIIHLLVWEPGYLDQKLLKLQRGYFRGFIVRKEGESTVLRSVQWVEIKDVPAWVAERYPKKDKGGWKGSPKNEKSIMFQVLLKAAVEIYVHTGSMSKDVPAGLLVCVEAAKDNLEEACKAVGVL